MNKTNPSFFQVLKYVLLFALLIFFIWANKVLGDTITGITTIGIWLVVLGIACVLRFFSYRKTWFSALETSWFVLLVLFWLLVFIDTAACSTSTQGFCQPALWFDSSSSNLSNLTYSIIIFTLPLAALCFPWGIPLFYGWVQLLPGLFEMAGIPLPESHSLLGRFCLFFPGILMVPLGYWTWFCFVPSVANSLWKGFRVEQIGTQIQAQSARCFDWGRRFSGNMHIKLQEAIRKKRQENNEDGQESPSEKTTTKKPARRRKVT